MLHDYYEIKTIANAVRNIDLKLVLIKCGALEDKSDRNKWHTLQGVISVSGTKFMNWNKGTGGGGAIDLIIHLQSLNFINAVLWLRNQFHSPPATGISNEIKPVLQVPCRQPLKLPTRDDSQLSRIVTYLTQKRHIPQHLIKDLVDSGKLYADTKSNAVFLLLCSLPSLSGKEKRVGAELRGTTDFPWRGMATGSNKSIGYFYMKNQSNKIILCESAIDAISAFVIYPDYMTISTSGANPNPAWLNSFVQHGYEVYCGFDSDQTGDILAEKMISLYPSVKRLRPDKHDWNEILISKSVG